MLFHIGELIYFLILITAYLMGHPWKGVLIGVIGCVAWWSFLWKMEFGTWKFWKD